MSGFQDVEKSEGVQKFNVLQNMAARGSQELVRENLVVQKGIEGTPFPSPSRSRIPKAQRLALPRNYELLALFSRTLSHASLLRRQLPVPRTSSFVSFVATLPRLPSDFRGLTGSWGHLGRWVELRGDA